MSKPNLPPAEECWYFSTLNPNYQKNCHEFGIASTKQKRAILLKVQREELQIRDAAAHTDLSVTAYKAEMARVIQYNKLDALANLMADPPNDWTSKEFLEFAKDLRSLEAKELHIVCSIIQDRIDSLYREMTYNGSAE